MTHCAYLRRVPSTIKTKIKGLSARIPAKLKHFAGKDSRQNSILEQILIAKVFNFGGICSK
jgi:hypothetical protein